MKTTRMFIAPLIIAFCFTAVQADETDQFTLPDRDTFYDAGPYFNLFHYRILEMAVERANENIREQRLLQPSPRRNEQLARLTSGEYIADQVRNIIGPGFFDMRNLENMLHSSRARKVSEGQIFGYKTPTWIYFYTHLPIDPRKIVLLFQASTVQAYGVHFGTDKFGHFHDLGHLYYKDYLWYRRNDYTHEDAMEQVIRIYSDGPISERGVIGLMATGVLSNADLASNYAGMKFYKNLTEPTMVAGEMQPPLVIRHGDYWRLNHHVRPDNDWFAIFITDHWNEALNPCIYEPGIRWTIANRLRAMAADIRAFYADEHGNERPREWFRDKAEELVTYYGEDYGHTGVTDEMLLISDYCYPDPEDDEDQAETE